MPGRVQRGHSWSVKERFRRPGDGTEWRVSGARGNGVLRVESSEDGWLLGVRWEGESKTDGGWAGRVSMRSSWLEWWESAPPPAVVPCSRGSEWGLWASGECLAVERFWNSWGWVGIYVGVSRTGSGRIPTSGPRALVGGCWTPWRK